MIEEIKSLGLTETEARVYITLSKLGTATAYKVAKEANLYKSNAYDAIKKLIERGLAEQKIIDQKVLYEASDPKYLIEIADMRKEEITKIVPQLKLLHSESGKSSEFHIFHGRDALLSILNSWLDFKEPILVYGIPKNAAEKIGPKINLFHKERIRRKIKMNHIYNFNSTERIKFLKRLKYTPIKRLPETFDSAAATNICGDEVVFILWEPNIKIYQIKDKDLASVYKRYFDILWKQATDFK